MLIIFALAFLALLAVVAIVIGLPLLIVVALVGSRRRNRAETIALAGDSDAEFVALVKREWPQEAVLLNAADPSVG